VERSSFTYVIKQLELALRPHFDGLCAAVGMTPAQLTALTVLQRRPGITSSDLARRSFVRAQTMAATVEPMLEAGLLRREKDPTHARRMLLYLTDKGAEVAATLAPGVDQIEEIIVRGFTDEERDEFARLLRRARNSMHEAVAQRASPPTPPLPPVVE